MSFWSRQFLFIALVFAISRLYIFNNPPLYYSDVTADYERYANMWRYGLTPYREHLYEYPPATIPLLSLPLELDQSGVGKYYPNYRAQILVIDTLFFIFLLASLTKMPWTKSRVMELSLAYILITSLGKNFFYEGIDLAFTASITSAFLLPLWLNTKKLTSQVLVWTLLWLSVAIKFLTLPLIVPLALLMNFDFKKTLFAILLGLALVWSIPLVKYRSSLQVMFVHNNNRPIKYASFPAHIIQWVDNFTHSEKQVQKAPDFTYVGPVSKTVTKVNKTLFPIAILSFAVWSSFKVLRKKYPKKDVFNFQSLFSIAKMELSLTKNIAAQEQVFLSLKLLGIYFFVLFLSAKIFSQPFHIWYMPLLILFPFSRRKEWYQAFGLALLMVLLDMTELLHVKNHSSVLVGSIPVRLVRDLFRFLPMFMLIFLFGKTKDKFSSQAWKSDRKHK